MAALPADEGAEKGAVREPFDDSNPMKGLIHGNPAVTIAEMKAEGNEMKVATGKLGGGKKKKGKR